MALSAVPDRDDDSANDDHESTEALPTMGQLIRETSLLLPGLKPGQKIIDNINVRVTEHPHSRDLHAIDGPAHHVETQVVTVEFQRKGRTPTFTLVGEYGNEMQPILWDIKYSAYPGSQISPIYGFHNPNEPHTGVNILHVQRLQKLLQDYRGRNPDE